MFDVARSLAPGLANADRQMKRAAAQLARANVGDRAALGRAMASGARTALFEEALLGAIHARLAELRSVTQ